jgi:hypothetical protein
MLKISLKIDKTNRYVSLFIFFFYFTATTSGSLFHNHKLPYCDHHADTKGHISLNDSCSACDFLAVNNSNTIINFESTAAIDVTLTLHQIHELMIVRQNEWAYSIILRAPPSSNT